MVDKKRLVQPLIQYYFETLAIGDTNDKLISLLTVPTHYLLAGTRLMAYLHEADDRPTYSQSGVLKSDAAHSVDELRNISLILLLNAETSTYSGSGGRTAYRITKGDVAPYYRPKISDRFHPAPTHEFPFEFDENSILSLLIQQDDSNLFTPKHPIVITVRLEGRLINKTLSR